MEPDLGGSGTSALENKLNAMDAVYKRYGRDGLKDYPIADVTMLLASKQLELRDLPKGREVGESQKEANRLLELEIRDLSCVMDSHIASAGFNSIQRFVRPPQQDFKQAYKPKDNEKDR